MDSDGTVRVYIPMPPSKVLTALRTEVMLLTSSPATELTLYTYLNFLPPAP